MRHNDRSGATAPLCAPPGRRLLVGHHPLYSSGSHGGSVGENGHMRELLLPLIDECDIDVYLSGHEHHQEHLRAGGLHQVVQGAAGKLRSVGQRSSGSLAEQLFVASRFGFAIAEITADAIELEFYGYPAGSPAAFGSIHRATIASRR